MDTSSLHSVAAILGRLPPAALRARSQAIAALRQPESKDVLAALRSLDDPFIRAVALVKVASGLLEDQRQAIFAEAIQAAHSIDHAYRRSQTLAAVAARQASLAEQASLERCPRALQDALQTARSIEDAYWRSRALAAIANRLSREHRETVLQQAHQDAMAIDDIEARGQVLAALVPDLPVDQALLAARAIADERARAAALFYLAEWQGDTVPDLVEEALEVLAGLEEDEKPPAVETTLKLLAQRILPQPASPALAEELNPESSGESGGVLPSGEALAALMARVGQQIAEFLNLAPIGKHVWYAPGLAGSNQESGGMPIDFGTKQVKAWRDVRAGRITFLHKKNPAGTLLYVAFAKADGTLKPPEGWPAPFSRVLWPALQEKNPVKRVDALLRLAGAIRPPSRSDQPSLRVDLRQEALRTAGLLPSEQRRRALAMIASLVPAEQQKDWLEDTGYDKPVPVTDGFTPRSDERILWERFVMLRPGQTGPEAWIHVEPFPGHPETLPFQKVVAFAAEVEVAPDLLRQSLQDAHRDPLSRPLWREWLNQNLASHPDLTAFLDLIGR
jgi:hypothetical protein